MERFVAKLYILQILEVWQGSEYASALDNN